MRETDCSASECILVFDLGGGTFDVSVLKYGGKSEFKVLAVSGEAFKVLAVSGGFLGGEYLDVKMAKCLLGELASQDGDLSEKQRIKMYPRFVRAGRQAKEKLLHMSSVDVVVQGVAQGGGEFVVKLSRAKFEKFNADFFKKLMPVVRQGVRNAGLLKSDINRVLMVGGSSRIPALRKLLENEFGREPEETFNPDEAVADGAAVLAFQLAKPLVLTKTHWNAIAVQDVVAHSLGVAYWAGDCTVTQIRGNDQLAERLIREGAQSEEVQVSLMWHDLSDLDLGGVRVS